jgi:hypothetical protein
MEGQTLVILIVSMVVALLWLVLRFGRQIARAVLVLGILILGILTALALLSQAGAARQAAKAATVVASGQVIMAFCSGAMGAVTVGALGLAGYWWVRFRLLAQHHMQRPSRQRALPEHKTPDVVYIVEDRSEALSLEDIDLSQWGWG